MSIFSIQWDIIIDAEDKEDAAKQAFGMMQDPQNTATFLRITNHETLETSLEDYEYLLRETTT